MTPSHDSNRNHSEAELCEVPENYLEPDDGGLAAQALPPVDAPLPLPSGGLYGYYDASKRYGIVDVVASLVEVGRIWKLRSKVPDVGIGDISKMGGGQIPGHASHRKGIDVDIRPLQKNGQVGPVTFRDQKYSQELCQELADIMHANGKLAVQFVLFNDPDVQGVRPYPNHDNHLHVRFLAPGTGPTLPVLAHGMRDPSVRELQRRLNFWIASMGQGSPGPVHIDGDFGNATLAAAKAFQQLSGLTADGKVGAETWCRLPLAPGAGSRA